MLFLALIVTWMFATPIGAGPDEPTQITRAAALVRGDVVGAPVRSSTQNAYTVVHAPQTFATIQPACYAFRPDVPAGCAPPVTANRRSQAVTIYVGHEPPPYYAALGVLTFLPGGSYVIYLMRFLGAVIDAAFLAISVAALRRWHPSPRALLGVVLAVTPMVLFQASIVSGSGIETAAAIATWTALATWFSIYGLHPPDGLVVVATVSATVLAAVRPVSMVWTFVMVAVLLPLVLGGSGGRELLQRRVVRVGGLTVGVVTAVAVAWLFGEHSLDVIRGGVPAPGTPLSTILSKVLTRTGQSVSEAVGNFGWIDTPLPHFMVWMWWTMVVGSVLWALVWTSWRGRTAVLLLAVAAFVVPVGSETAAARTVGFAAQGRYYLPLWVGLPIVAWCVAAGDSRRDVASASGSRWERLVTGATIIVVGIIQLVAVGSALRRFLVGANGPIWPTSTVRRGWHPPVPGLLIDIVALLAVSALTAYLLRFGMAWRRSTDSSASPTAPM